MENKNTPNLGWYSSDYYNQFANAQAQVALAKAKLIGDSFMATKESMGSFNQPLNGYNPIFPPRYLGGAKLPGNEMGGFMRPNTLEQAYMMGGEQPAYQRYYNENMPDNGFDGPEQVEENFGPQKRVQKSNFRNGQNESDSKNRNPM